MSGVWHRLRFRLGDAAIEGPEHDTLDEAPTGLPEGVEGRVEADLIQWFEPSTHGVTAQYVFNARYLAAHPEARDPRHLRLWMALLNFKLFDEGDLIAPGPMLAGALRWPGVATPRRPLGA
ncbi:MAG: hypothetical protein JNK72_11645 [Myxococcales bacterium]|nr:hypothetical protein [Myxococcales bacterium]